MTDFSGRINRMLSEAVAKLDLNPAPPAPDSADTLTVEALGEVRDRLRSNEPELTVRKWTHIMPVSCCVLTDPTGVNYCADHAPLPPIPWWRRAYWRWQSRWWDLRLRLGSWIAGRDLDDDE